MRAFLCFAAIVCLAFIVADRVLAEDLSELMKTDIGGNLRSHMWLAAAHGYNVSADGIVTIGNMRYEIWPEVIAI